ncbi:hypothetical protein AJ80_02502 [Polytolypa hystricis UAMH7299]|uniref:Filamentation protein n=1 Tax=Polytolypa hystricis (strain UAMH7299) TaxID=1447883 RepID=A0A2B7YRA8_POLH7|nr:hypothetical protein AJ80_02502 [Polytolypa hystricis UAMH7299]
MSGRTPEKGRRYIESLDAARCNGNWPEVPELLRKISKHSPQQKCLIQTVEAECQIAAYIAKRPGTASTPTANGDSRLSGLIPTLLSVIEDEGELTQDTFQTQVCLGWLHWALSEPALASSRLPKDFQVTLETLLDNGEVLSPWTEVCLVKGAYLKGAAQSLASGSEDAMRTFASILPWLSSPISSSQSNPQFLFWSEKVLAKSALIAAESTRNHRDQQTADLALKSFRLWADHPEVKRGDPASTVQSNAPASPGSRSTVWKAYYDFLTAVLQEGLYYTPTAEGPKRVQLSTEFRRIEAICENALLRNTKFPSAGTTNTHVEEWVEQVIRNWEVFCGSSWSDDDFGQGGQDAVARNVLDILYRAATKTFHSTLILRRLFHVHATLTEFDLAVKALETYVEIATNAKDRAARSTHQIGEVEDDETFAHTLSEGIIVLCCFGNQKEAEKAKYLAELLQDALNISGDATNGIASPQQASHSNGEKQVSPIVLALSYRAIGIGLANCARWTRINESRTEIQSSAINFLEKSLAPELGEDTDISASFALALLLAEIRDLDSAIDCLRTALVAAKPTEESHSRHIIHSKERDLVPLWHLLSLLLSARQDFETASYSCDAALDTSPNSGSLFAQNGNLALRNGHENGERSNRWLSLTARRNIAADMEAREKESIIELRMTQLSLIEIENGPEAALNHSDELLGLFGHLFKNVGLEMNGPGAKLKPDTLAPPKSSAGTVRSLRGSIFGRKRSVRHASRGTEIDGDANTIPQVPSISSSRNLPSDVDTPAPAIEITDGDRRASSERPRTGGRRNSLRQKDGRQAHKLHRREGSLSKAVRQRSMERHRDENEPSSTETTPVKKHGKHRHEDDEEVSLTDITSPTTGHNRSSSARHTLPRVAHNMKHSKQPAPAGHKKQPPQQDIRLPTTGRFDSPTRAITRFPRVQAQKQALSLLTKIWLFIAGLYRRASLFEDANEACNEAANQANRVESLVAAQESSARAFAEAGWGVTKSSDELWADIFTERGYVAQAQTQPYKALENFEEAVTYFPDHVRATIGLCNLLLDMYDETLPAEEPEPDIAAELSAFSLFPPVKLKENDDDDDDDDGEDDDNWPLPASEPVDAKSTTAGSSSSLLSSKKKKKKKQKDTPEYLNRLAARDRAYGLLSTLIKLGTAWDDSEAWFALSRAYEQGEQIEKAKEVLWWCVELEDRKPVRHWWNLGSGGYVL